MIGHNQMTQEREERIAKLKKELGETQQNLESTEVKLGSAQIELTKVKDQLNTSQKDLTDTVSKLHTTDKVRHETEIKLGEEMERAQGLQEALKLKDEQMARKTQEMDELDKRHVEQVRANESLDTKRQTLERQFEVTRKQLNERVSNLNEIINGEKETSKGRDCNYCHSDEHSHRSGHNVFFAYAAAYL